jgi:hypothetical protein
MKERRAPLCAHEDRRGEEGEGMQLELSDAEVAELRQLLDSALGELSTEIADTDNAQFARELRARRDALRAVQERLGPPA